MAFDQKTRNLLQRTVTACRRALDREFTAQLQELYGIQPDGSLTPIAELDHLGDEQLDVARLLRERINHLEGGSAAEALTRTAAKPEHIARVIREQAFTVLNRLAALRLCEERGLVLECVRQGVNSEGFQLFMSSAGNALGETHEAYRVYLHCLFDELAIDLGVLFDRFSPLALLFPRPDALAEVLSELNGTGKAAEREEMPPEQFAKIWQADETIGWIYQYYNDETERKKMREESSAPRNSRELAVRNQFFTPRYVVEFLTDNTLGRIWYEMTGGITSLKEKCRYLVRRPNEIFLKPGENPPATNSPSAANVSPSPPAAGGEGRGEVGSSNPQSQEELLRAPVFIPHRPLKDPRTILMLDPACGSMHFGLYAFDLFEVIYAEAWEMEEVGTAVLSRPPGMKSLRKTFATKEEFLRQVPRLIIEHNIHGIDIDPRAAQIAGLALWLRAQRVWKEMGIAPAQRPRITRSNIVCAEPMPGEKELLREFVEKEFPAAERGVFLQLLETIFDKMQLAGEAGSLLKIEEEIRSAIEDARTAWQKLQTKPKELFSTSELNAVSKQPELTDLEQSLHSALRTPHSAIAEDFWGRLEERIYAALRDYAEQAESSGGYQRRLFAEDAARGFAFIDVCRKRCDVALMNPPFGDATPSTLELVRKDYPEYAENLYVAFHSRSSVMIVTGGLVGIISSRTFVAYRDFEKFRGRLLGKSPLKAFADLGWEVLDGAQVETAAYITTSGTPSNDWFGPFFRLLTVPVDKKETELLSATSLQTSERTFYSRASSLQKLPGSPLCYWSSEQFIDAVSNSPSLYPARAYVGLGASPHAFFFRVWWEVAVNSFEDRWRRICRGGDYAPFYRSNALVIDWYRNGGSVKEYILKKYPYLNGNYGWKIQDEDKYGLPGLTWGKRNERFNVQAMPGGHIFTDEGQGIIPADTAESIFLLGYMNSAFVAYFLSLTSGLQKHYVYIRPVPVLRLSPKSILQIKTVTTDAVKLIQKWNSTSETSPLFALPMPNFLIGQHGIRNSATTGQKVWEKDSDVIAGCRAEINRVVFSETVLSADDIMEIQSLTATFPKDVPNIDGFVPTVNETENDLTKGQVSYWLGSAFGRWDIRYATGVQAAPVLPDPFAPLPVCPPGQLQNAQGLPARPEDVPATYPITIQWDGIIADAPTHPVDIERCVREVIETIWSGSSGRESAQTSQSAIGNRQSEMDQSLVTSAATAESIEHEACEILGVNSLRDYFRRPAGFFANHLKRYSKSRRQAPIYWPLSTASGSYTLWIYYHRLDDQTLYKCIQQFIDPKLADVEKELTHLRTVLAANEGGAKERKRLEELETLRHELIELRTELELWAPKWKPNLNDGVLITAAPLWKLFRLPKWQRDLKACWQELEKGDYDWAHLAYTLWPDRVREKCKSDRSLAIAHGLEELCDVKAPEKKVKKAKKKMEAELEIG